MCRVWGLIRDFQPNSKNNKDIHLRVVFKCALWTIGRTGKQKATIAFCDTNFTLIGLHQWCSSTAPREVQAAQRIFDSFEIGQVYRFVALNVPGIGADK
jgi:hypothetical protein